MADLNHLYGSCACERNQYTVIIPSSSASLAQVFFDNSTANRRSQASPVTAWLRVPLDWYHSTTYALFSDETHGTIKRTYHTHPMNEFIPPTRRQFCGYCGTHLTAWNEGQGGMDRSRDFVDVTLGSLLNESLDRLEALQMYHELDDDEDDGLVRDPGATINEPDHIPMPQQQQGSRSTTTAEGLIKDPNATINEPDHIREQPGGLVRDPNATINEPDHVPITQVKASDFSASRPDRPVAHRMNHRGIPYFEEMVENSRLGRIKRQMGGHTSADGSRSVQWEVFEVGADEDEPMMESGGGVSAGGEGTKRLKMDV